MQMSLITWIIELFQCSFCQITNIFLLVHVVIFLAGELWFGHFDFCFFRFFIFGFLLLSFVLFLGLFSFLFRFRFAFVWFCMWNVWRWWRRGVLGLQARGNIETWIQEPWFCESMELVYRIIWWEIYILSYLHRLALAPDLLLSMLTELVLCRREKVTFFITRNHRFSLKTNKNSLQNDLNMIFASFILIQNHRFRWQFQIKV